MPARTLTGLLLAGLGLLVALSTAITTPARAQSFEEALQALDASSFDEKEKAVAAMAALDDERVVPVLVALEDGQLYRRKEDGRFVIGERRGRAYDLIDVLTGEQLGQARSRDLDKVRVNNRLRGAIMATLGRLQLGSPDRAKRLAAVGNILRDRSPAAADQLRAALAEETDPEVRDAPTGASTC